MSDQTKETRGTESATARPKRKPGKAHASEQPFEYPLTREFAEPDWTRLPGFSDVTTEQWESAQWQRAHTVKNLTEFKRALGDRETEFPSHPMASRDSLHEADMWAV
ncbi:MAG TPA: hypothetical protein VFR44_11010, partial [Actinomycetota bacterium]|nr:hypothetical protein [Actinomycetota bacterium]